MKKFTFEDYRDFLEDAGPRLKEIILEHAAQYCKIYDNTEFIYREYTVMQPLQRSYGFTEERIRNMLQAGALKPLWDDAKVAELEEKGTTANAKEQKALADYHKSKPAYDAILERLGTAMSDWKWLSPDAFAPELEKVLSGIDINARTAAGMRPFSFRAIHFVSD